MATGQVLLISSGIFVYLSWYAYRKLVVGLDMICSMDQ
jgi:hypothetical protein